MKKGVVTYCFILSVCTSISPICLGAESTPTAIDLLNKYTRALDSTSSFIHQYQSTTQFSYKLQSGTALKGESFCRGQVRHDDQQVYYQEYGWGDFNSRLMDLPKDKPYYRCNIKNRSMYYQNAKHINQNSGSVTWQSRPEGECVNLSRLSGIAPLVGYIGSDERLDRVLRQSDSVVSVRSSTEIIDGSECFVMEANTKYGHYKIWLDSNHGFHPVKILHVAKEGEFSFEHLLQKGETARTYLMNVRFEQIDGVWVPVEADTGSHNTASKGVFTKEDTHYKRLDIMLNPDHEKLGSFADPLHENPANDPELQNGTLIRKVGFPITYLWQDGKLIPNIDREAVHQIDTLTESILSKEKAQEETVTLAGILAAYQNTQDSLAFFYCESQTDGKEAEAKQFRYARDGQRLCFQVLSRDKTV